MRNFCMCVTLVGKVLKYCVMKRDKEWESLERLMWFYDIATLVA